jgi:hypothetical protein
VASTLRILAVTLAVVLCLAIPVFSQSEQAPEQAEKGQEQAEKPSGTAELRIELTGGETKRPISDASVYVKFTDDGLLRDKRVELNLKTNQNGVARSPQIPKGRVLIQIVAPGWKTFGQWYDVDRNQQVIAINLERPTNRWLQP